MQTKIFSVNFLILSLLMISCRYFPSEDPKSLTPLIYNVWKTENKNGFNYDFISFQSKVLVGVIPVVDDTGISNIENLAMQIKNDFIKNNYYVDFKEKRAQLVIRNNHHSFSGYELNKMEVNQLEELLRK